MLVVANLPWLDGGSGVSLPASIAGQISADRTGGETVIYLCALLLAFVTAGGIYGLLRW